MRCAIDARMIEMSGIGTYIQNLMDRGIYQIALGDEKTIKKYDSDVQVIPFNEKIYSIKEQLKFPYSALKKEKINCIHFPHYNIPLFYRRRYYVTIHDLTHLKFPEFLPNRMAYYYAKIFIGYACKKSKIIFTVSNNSKKDLIDTFGISPEKIKVTFNAVSSDYCIKSVDTYQYMYKKYNIPNNKKIFLYVGNLKPHKNLVRLIKAFSKLNNVEDYVLVLVGKTFTSLNLKDIIGNLIDKVSVIQTGIVKQEELIYLYNMANIFVFPSLYEGFGIPPLEAMACGTLVVCSNNSSLPEVVGTAAIMFNPYSVKEIKSALEHAINLSPQEREEYIINGFRRVKKFTWDETARIIKMTMGNNTID